MHLLLLLGATGGRFSAATAAAARLAIREGVAVGHKQTIPAPWLRGQRDARHHGGDATDGSGVPTLELETLSLVPLVFRVPGFLNATECAHLRQLAAAAGLQDGYTTPSADGGPGGGGRSLTVNDVDGDGFLSSGELMLMVDSLVDGHVGAADIDSLVERLRLDQDGDGRVSKAELMHSNPAAFQAEAARLLAGDPSKRSRQARNGSRCARQPDSSRTFAHAWLSRLKC